MSPLLSTLVLAEREYRLVHISSLFPLLSTLVLAEPDKEFERRGHTFVRYAGDCNIYVKPKRAGERTMASLKRFLEGEGERRVKRRIVHGSESSLALVLPLQRNQRFPSPSKGSSE